MLFMKIYGAIVFLTGLALGVAAVRRACWLPPIAALDLGLTVLSVAFVFLGAMALSDSTAEGSAVEHDIDGDGPTCSPS
jgi:hypothetical protein